ncbi:MAG: PAS domain S-box protein [Desulfocapsaceae bacterium]|nr:PAS domain S-box protein [Desulfocapsaceae bacterium]
MQDQINASFSKLAFLEKRVADLESQALQLQADYRHLKQLYDQYPLGYQSLDGNGCLLEVNQAWLATLGYTREEVIGRNFSEFLHPDWQDHFKDYFPKLKAIGEILGFEFEMIRKDGSSILVSFDGKINKDSEGRFQHTHCIFQDITERKRAEQALQKSEDKYRKIIETTGTGYVILDDQGRVIDANQEYAKLTGRKTVEDVLGHSVLEWTAPHDLERNKLEVGKCAEQGFVRNIEIDYLTPSGQFTPIAINATALRFAGRLQILSLCQDVSERKRVEKELTYSLSLVQSTLEATADGLLVVDSKGNIVGHNNRFAEMWRIPSGLLDLRNDELTLNFVLDQLKYPDEFLDLVKVLYDQPEEERFDILEFKDGRIFERYTQPQLIGGIAVGRVWSFRDVTESKRTAATLLESERRFRDMLSTVKQIAVILDLQGNIVFCNDFLLESTGWQQAEVLGKNWFKQFVAKQAVTKTQEVFSAAIRTGIVSTFYENEIITKQGLERLISWSNTVLRDEQGQIIGTASLGNDITERKRAEAYREISREVLQILNKPGGLSGSIQCVLDVLKTRTGFDAVGIRLQNGDDFPYFAQKGFPQDFYLRENTLIGRTTDGEMCRDKDGRVRLECTCGLVISGKTDPDSPLFTPAGSFWVNDSGPLLDIPLSEDPRFQPRNQCIQHGYASIALIPIRNNEKIIGLIHFCDKRKGRFTSDSMEILEGIASHIGEVLMRKQAEESLRESNEKFVVAFNTAPVIIAISNLDDGTYLDVNQRFLDVSGFDRDEVVGKSSLELGLITHSVREQFKEQIKKQGKIENIDLAVYTKSGKEILCKYWGEIIMISNRKCLLSISVDITEHRKVEQQLRQAQKMESVGLLAGGMAHDFNNMLGVILGHAEIAIDQADPTQPLVADLKEILKAANRSADLTRQLLAFARKQPIEPRRLNLNETIEGLLKLLRRLIGDDINLVWLPGEGLWPVKADPSQIDQMLANLCVNARDSISGVGKIIVETGNSILDAEYCAAQVGSVPGEYVRISMSDSGCGIDKPTLSRIFEPFFTTKEVGKGTGLGLSTVYGAVKQNNGFIDVTSTPGQGTTFTVYLPRYVDVGTDGQAFKEIAQESAAGGYETILLVEDEPAVLEMTRIMLQRLGYNVLAASAPSKAISILEGFAAEIHLLMTDVIMPEMNGRDLAERLVNIKKGMKCLYMSGYTSDIIANQGILNEGMHFIQKPFSRKVLAAAIREVLGTEERA